MIREHWMLTTYTSPIGYSMSRRLHLMSRICARIERSWRTLEIDQDLGLRIMLWLAHFFPQEPWAQSQSKRALQTLERMWVEPPGYICRAPGLRNVKFAFTNFGVCLGLQAADVWPGRVNRINTFFEQWRSGDEYDREAITWVMACTAHIPGAFVERQGQAEGLLKIGGRSCA
jgi:hypothetical protein